MSRTNFENLRVYKLSEELADTTWDVVLGWDDFSRSTVGRQIVRSADSVGAKIAEGVGRGSYQDNRRFVRIARGSLNETKHFPRRAYRRNLLRAEDTRKLRSVMDELSPKLNAYLKSIGPIATETAIDPEND